MLIIVLGVLALLCGYLFYSRLPEHMFMPFRDDTPAVSRTDGMDFVPQKRTKNLLIQFLNIAGVGPICGAIMGAQFGTASFLWIVFGSIFAGAVHDFVAGFISLRNDGASLPEIHGKYLGKNVKNFMAWFTIILMVLVGAVFVKTPAQLLVDNFTPGWPLWIWPVLIFAYYLVATLLPIDKVIGRIYPIFGFLLLAMAVMLVGAFFIRPEVQLIEIWDGLENRHPQRATNPIFPMMFVSIACGAISGFHATQSPLMARCMINEKQARPIFYGAMITEGVVALIWAAAAAYFFHDKPELCAGKSGDAMVGVICNEWFPKVLAVVSILGVICAAITSGDTAMRSARLIVADQFHIDQRPMAKRIAVALPLFVLSGGLLIYAFSNADGFQTIWRYFAWCNQILAVFTLWAITAFLFKKGKGYAALLTLLPANFMTYVCASFILVAHKEGLGSVIPNPWGYIIAGAITLVGVSLAPFWMAKMRGVQRAKRLRGKRKNAR